MARLLERKGASFDNPLMGAGPWQSGVYRRRSVIAGAPAATPAAPAAAVPRVRRPTGVNAKNIQFDRPGAGLEGYGVDASNVYTWIERNRAAQSQKAGGQAQLWENLSRYTSTPQAARLDPVQAREYNAYIRTGKRGAGLSDRTTLAAYDWALREAGRFQQHKPKGFLSSTLGKIVTIAAQVGASFIPGVGPYVSAAIGGVTGGVTGGPVGALLGAAGGYGVGKGTQWIRGGGIGTLLGRGAVTNVNALMPAAYGARATTGAASLATGGLAAGGAVAKGATSYLETAANVASVANTAIGLRNLAVGAATTGAAYLASQAFKPPGMGTVLAAPAARMSEEQKAVERLRRRRRATQTDLTWGGSDPALLGRPTLLGGSTRLGA